MKLCKYCGHNRPDDWFEICAVVKGKVYRRLRCRRCKRECSNARRVMLRLWMREYKKTLHCARCGIHDHRVLEFHHPDGADKDFDVGYMVGVGFSKASILREIEKCIVLCANCHRILHYEEDDGEEELLAEELNSAGAGSSRSGRHSRARRRRRG
jgi:hypothetical protein